MKVTGTLKNPPIKEAIIDIQFDSESLDFEKLLSLIDIIPISFEDPQLIRTQKVKLIINEDGDNDIDQDNSEFVGYRWVSTDGASVLQLKKNSITYSCLNSYKTWDEFKQQAKLIWIALEISNKVKRLNRLAVRYVNDIQIPLNNKGLELSDYFVNDPKTPEGMTDGISEFFSRVSIPYHELKSKAIVVQAFNKFENDILSVILDIDIYSEEVKHFDDNEMWLFFDKLRVLKNIAFFGSITQKTKELFE
ncbi:MAG: TIGR04255 family protein [Colwellia sp.]|nr:TIGR04255 family protein [Colwellia sp.]